MLESVCFENFRVLRGTRLPLGPFTLLVGPNGSGKSTAIQALQFAESPGALAYERVVSAAVEAGSAVSVEFGWGGPFAGTSSRIDWSPQAHGPTHSRSDGSAVDGALRGELDDWLARIRVYGLTAERAAAAVPLSPNMELDFSGFGLAGVLDRIRDLEPERFEALNRELGRWLPEFDRILFDTPQSGTRTIKLRTREGGYAIAASDLSHGILLALALLTLVYSLGPPSMVCLEEPDHGIHPRLFQHVVDALYRLSYPSDFGEAREPVQVLATTHSPYLVDLFRDHPEQVVVANRVGIEAQFERLSDRPDMGEILGGASLGEIWYSGILGGVPAER